MLNRERSINVATVKKAVQGSVPLNFEVDGPLSESFGLIEKVLEIVLDELGQEAIREPLSFCLKELISNAQKAELKRVYFEQEGLDIHSAQDYQRGMRGFRQAIDDGSLLRELPSRGKRVAVGFQSAPVGLTLSVSNGSSALPEELARIKERIERARGFESLTQALDSLTDQTEGGGLGIVMLIQFLKTFGLHEEAFTISSTNGRTVASLVIPWSHLRLDQIRLLTEFLLRDVESLPHLPDSVMRVVRLTENEDAKLADVAAAIAADPTLTADLLKHVNSSFYGLPSRVTSIPQTVKLLGLKGLHSLLISLGFRRLLAPHHSRLKGLLEHSLKTGSYASILARDFLGKREIADDVFAAGVLHDLGLIVLTSVQPRILEKMRRFSMEKDIPPQVLERFSFGMSHADIGAVIAEKWSLPPAFVESIRYHHHPLAASAACRDVVYCVYLANAVCDLERGMARPAQLERAVLREFGISSDEQAADLVFRLRDASENRKVEASR